MAMAGGWWLLALALPVGAELPGVAVEYHGDNGSVPPPYRRSTSITIDAEGHGRLLRLHGYDHSDAAQRFEFAFVLAAERRAAFARRLQELKLWETRWREPPAERMPIGGPLVHLRFRRGEEQVAVPPVPVAKQRELAQELRAEVLALLPAEAIAAREAWERGRPAED